MTMKDGRPWTAEDVAEVIANPFHALRGIGEIMDHTPIVSEEQWVESNVILMEEIGQKAWLRLLLGVLKGFGGGVTREKEA